MKIKEYESKLDEIKSYVEPKESEEMTWEKFMQILADQLAQWARYTWENSEN